MTNRKQLMCFAAFTALVALSGLSRADDYSYPVVNFTSEERVSEPMTCAQATQLAWFKHQMELSDGGNDNTVPAPAECQRDQFAQSDVSLDAGESE